MTSAKPKPKETHKERQERDQREFERLVAELKHILEHRSPGLWDWWDDTVTTASDWAADAWDTVTTTASKAAETVQETAERGWDTLGNYASSAVDIVSTWVDDGIEWGNDIVDTYIWDTTSDEAVVESWVRDTFDIPDQEGKGFVTEVAEGIEDDWDEHVDTVTRVVGGGGQTIVDTVKETADKAGDIINNISLALGVGFDAAMAALAGLPELLTEWRADLAAFFDFDIDELLTMWQEAQQKVKETKVD